MEYILVIKHGAFGDVINAEGAFRAIRAHHKNSHITLLTSSPFKNLAQESDYFDAVEIDDRKPFWHLKALFQVRKIFRKYPYARIYDLQTSSRTALYYQYLKDKQTEWVGAISDSPYYFPKAMHSKIHIFERHRKQLETAGLKNIPDASNEWLVKNSQILEKLPGKFVVLVTGASKEEKCWPIENYLALCELIFRKGFHVVLTGTYKEASKINFILEHVSQRDRVISLMDQANFYDYATLSHQAKLVIGSDTGPFHLMALSKKPSILLISDETNFYSAVPKWDSLTCLKAEKIADIPFKEVETLVEKLLST